MVATVVYSLQTLESQFQANSNTSGDQLAPDVLGLSNGGYVVAYNNGNINLGVICLNFYDANGDPIGGAKIPSTGTTVAAGAPTLTQMSNGNVVVIWDDNDSADIGLKGAIFTPAGVQIGSEFEVTPYVDDTAPQVTALTGGDGGFVVADQFGQNVYAEVFDENGNSITGEFEVETTQGGNTEPVVTGLADGGFVVTWTHNNAGTLELRARIFEADGTPRTVNGSTNDFVVATIGNNSQASISALPNGNWAIAYTDSGWSDEDVGVTLTVVGPDGSFVNVFEHVNVPGDPNNEADPDIAVLDNGFIVVSWTYPFGPGDGDIYCRIFDQDGDPIAVAGFGPVIVLDGSVANDVKSAVSGILAGQFVAGWQDGDSDGSGGRITATVQELVRTTTGDGTSEALYGDQIRDIINGNGGTDTLGGFAGNDTLNGGAGADAMTGGVGNDTYVVDNANDTTVEAAGGGTDTVQTTITLTLASNVENLVLNGAAAINGNGNGAANTISGNAAANVLSGLSADDTLNGIGGNDRLDGGAGADAMSGGNGDDTYVVDNAGDTASEASGTGIDLVQSSVTFTLANGVENLVLNGTAAINGTGNGLANTLSGNSASNLLSGGGENDTLTAYGGIDGLNGDAGHDTLIGGEGDDTLRGGAGNDTMNGGNGNDTASYFGVSGGVTVALSVAGPQNTGGDGTDTLSSIEYLIGSAFGDTLSGTAGNNLLIGQGGGDTLTGFAGADTLHGDDGDDTLNGGANIDILFGGGNSDDLIGQEGNDILNSGDGADQFIFDDGHGSDTVYEFQNGSDKFNLTAVAGIDDIGDVTIIDNGATVTVDYGTGSFTIANVSDPGVLDATDFLF